MKTPSVRKYSSPLREAYAQETRERILTAFSAELSENPDGSVSFDQIAARAGVERRTVFRHFASKEALLDDFWVWVNARVGESVLPRNIDDLMTMPEQSFSGFDEQEGIIRASLHTQAGREMRLRALPKRQEHFSAAMKEVTSGLPEDEARHAEEILHVLYSAATWETLKDYCGLSGREAGRTVSWAIQTIAETLKSRAGDQKSAGRDKKESK